MHLTSHTRNIPNTTCYIDHCEHIDHGQLSITQHTSEWDMWWTVGYVSVIFYMIRGYNYLWHLVNRVCTCNVRVIDQKVTANIPRTAVRICEQISSMVFAFYALVRLSWSWVNNDWLLSAKCRLREIWFPEFILVELPCSTKKNSSYVVICTDSFEQTSLKDVNFARIPALRYLKLTLFSSHKRRYHNWRCIVWLFEFNVYYLKSTYKFRQVQTMAFLATPSDAVALKMAIIVS
jgi:hypothetical protein